MAETNDHFHGKEAIEHLVDVHTRGKILSSEIHGAETPGSVFVACDAARDSSILIVLFIFSIYSVVTVKIPVFALILSFITILIFYKASRAALIAWSHLERLHRMVEEEKHEIDVNRMQERQELKVLYQAKGFQGELLEDVVDTLMADGDRLLRIMLEEEMGFRIDRYQHPLVLALFAGLGVAITGVLIATFWYIWSYIGLVISGLFVFVFSSWVYAFFEGNRKLRTVVWNIAIFALLNGAYIQLLKFFFSLI